MVRENEDISHKSIPTSEYDELLILEELETLLEEMDEGAEPEHVAERLAELGLQSSDALRRRISEMHRRLDADE